LEYLSYNNISKFTVFWFKTKDNYLLSETKNKRKLNKAWKILFSIFFAAFISISPTFGLGHAIAQETDTSCGVGDNTNAAFRGTGPAQPSSDSPNFTHPKVVISGPTQSVSQNSVASQTTFWNFSVSLDNGSGLVQGGPLLAGQRMYTFQWLKKSKDGTILTQVSLDDGVTQGMGTNEGDKVQAQAILKINPGKQPATCSPWSAALTATTSTGDGQDPNAGAPDPLMSFISKIIQLILLLVVKIVYEIFALISPMIEILLGIQVHEFRFAGVILTIWVVIRNLMNVFFILALLAIAISTLFRLNSKWNYKDVLVDVAIMALLINFSLTIAQAILGVADTLQAQFLPANAEAIKRLGYELMVRPSLAIVHTPIFSNNAPVATLASSFIYFFLSVAAFMAFCAIAAFLVVRIVALWLLLMTSPVAYAAYVLPGQIRSYSTKWWSNFIKYAFFTPALALFLHICAVVANAQASYVNLAANVPGAAGDGAAGSIYNILSSVLVLACLIAGMRFAQGLGIAGSGLILDYAKKGTKRFSGYNLASSEARNQARNAAGRLNAYKQKKTAGLAGKGFLGRTAFMALNPGIASKERQARREKGIHDAEHLAEAAAKDRVMLGKSGGLIDLKNRHHALAHLNDEDTDYWKDKTADKIMEEVRKIENSSYGQTAGGRAQIRKALLVAFKEGKLKRWMDEETLPNGQKRYQGGYEQAGNLEQFFRDHVGSDPQAHIFMEDNIEKIAEEKKKVGLYHIADALHFHGDQEDKDAKGSLKYRDEQIVLDIKAMSPEDFEKSFDAKGLPRGKGGLKFTGVKKQKNAQGQVVEVPQYEFDEELYEKNASYREILQKIATNPQMQVKKDLVEQLVGMRVDRKTGKPIFKTEAEAQNWERIRESHPDAYIRLYNAAVGKFRPDGKSIARKDIPQEYVIESATETQGPTYIEHGADGPVQNDSIEAAPAGSRVEAFSDKARGGRRSEEARPTPPRSRGPAAGNGEGVEGFETNERT
jgi:hypothetical protein